MTCVEVGFLLIGVLVALVLLTNVLSGLSLRFGRDPMSQKDLQLAIDWHALRLGRLSTTHERDNYLRALMNRADQERDPDLREFIYLVCTDLAPLYPNTLHEEVRERFYQSRSS